MASQATKTNSLTASLDKSRSCNTTAAASTSVNKSTQFTYGTASKQFDRLYVEGFTLAPLGVKTITLTDPDLLDPVGDPATMVKVVEMMICNLLIDGDTDADIRVESSVGLPEIDAMEPEATLSITSPDEGITLTGGTVVSFTITNLSATDNASVCVHVLGRSA